MLNHAFMAFVDTVSFPGSAKLIGAPSARWKKSEGFGATASPRDLQGGRTCGVSNHQGECSSPNRFGCGRAEIGEPQPYLSSTTRLRSVPICEISTSSTSPAFIHTGGVRLAPMPSGVPVAMMSPGDSGVKAEQ